MPIVTDEGFRPDEPAYYVDREALPEDGAAFAVELPNDADPASLVHAFNRIALISVPFPSFADGRAFSIGRRLRDLGFRVGCARPGMSSPISTPSPASAASTRCRSTTISPRGCRRNSGCGPASVRSRPS